MKTLIKRGATLGMVAGAMMAMFSMVAMAAAGDGFWTPLNAIAHTLWNGAPLNGQFSARALIVGMVAHMATSMMLGVAVAGATRSLRRNQLATVGVATMLAMTMWAVQLAVWSSISRSAFDAFTPWVLLVGHAVFGMTAGVLVARSAATSVTLPTSDVRQAVGAV